jgi:hypothetical protein
LKKKETKERYLYRSRREIQEIMKIVIEEGKETTRHRTKAAN